MTLDGTGSFDPDKVDQLSYQWTQVEGSPVLLRNADTATAFLLVGAEGVYVFELVVSDGFSQSEPSRVRYVGVPVTITSKPIPATQLTSNAYYPDVSGTNGRVFQPRPDVHLRRQNHLPGSGERQDGDLRNLRHQPATENRRRSRRLVRRRHFTEARPGLHERLRPGSRDRRSAGVADPQQHQLVQSSGVSGQQGRVGAAPGIDKNVLANWANMPYDICGADVSNSDKPVHSPSPRGWANATRSPIGIRGGLRPRLEFGNIVVWEGNGNIYAADISDLNHIKIITVCDDPARQYDPAISGRLVVWTDEQNDRGDIYGADLSDWEQIRPFQVAKAPGMQSQPRSMAATSSTPTAVSPAARSWRPV